MTDLATAFAEPLKMALVNLTGDGERLEAQFNPMEFSETLGAVYARQVVPGLSHTVKQFVNTEDDVFEYTLFWTATNGGPADAERLKTARLFLKSLVYPRELAGAGAIARGGAHRVMFVWPNFLSVTCVITKLKFKYTRFNLLGKVVLMSCDVTMEEIRDVMVSSEEIRDEIDPKLGAA